MSSCLRRMGLKWLTFFIGLLGLIAIGMWFGEEQRANIMKTHAQERLDNVFEY